MTGMVVSGFGTLAMFEWDCVFPTPPFPWSLLSVWVDRTSSGGFWEVVGGRTKGFGAGGMDSVGDIGLLVGELDLPSGECSQVALEGDCIDWFGVVSVSFRT